MAKKSKEQITDSLTQVNTKSLGDVPAMAMGDLYSAMGTALSNAGINATSISQQSGCIANQASTAKGVNSLASIGVAVLDRNASEVVEKE